MRDYEYEISSFDDDGLHIIPVESLPLHTYWRGGVCPIKVTVDRVNPGHLDPALSGGQIVATQTRSAYMDIYR